MRALALALAFGFILGSGDAAGQEPTATIGIYADEAGTEPSLEVTPGVPFNIFVVAHDIPSSIQAWEGSIQGTTPRAFVLTTDLYGGWQVEYYHYQYLVCFRACKEPESAIPLVRLTMLTGEGVPPNTVLHVSGSNPSSLGGEPGYYDCDGEAGARFDHATPPDLAAGERYRLGTLVLNPSPSDRVSGDAPSFGKFKTRFH